MTTFSAVIITWNRPSYIRQSLASLTALDESCLEILVVDASNDSLTKNVVHDFPRVRYIQFAGGAGHMTRSRNEGLKHVRNDIICFLDDDALVRPGWLDALKDAFRDPEIGATAGRTCNGQPGEDVEGADQIGRLLPDGQLTGNFAADVPYHYSIDHGIGANMAFRRSLLERLGGFRTDYPGTALREDTDIFLRSRSLGAKAVFVPAAAVDHVAAPHVKGSRFDRRYRFWGSHNHVLLLIRNFGYADPIVHRWVFRSIVHELQLPRSAHRKLANLAILLSAILAALGRLTLQGTFRQLAPERSDPEGEEIRGLLRHSPPVRAHREP